MPSLPGLEGQTLLPVLEIPTYIPLCYCLKERKRPEFSFFSISTLFQLARKVFFLPPKHTVKDGTRLAWGSLTGGFRRWNVAKTPRNTCGTGTAAPLLTTHSRQPSRPKNHRDIVRFQHHRDSRFQGSLPDSGKARKKVFSPWNLKVRDSCLGPCLRAYGSTTFFRNISNHV